MARHIACSDRITCASLFFAALGIFGSAGLAALFALMVMLGPDPGPARTWYMMSTKAEAVGTLLVACAILALRARQWKEPACLGWRRTPVRRAGRADKGIVCPCNTGVGCAPHLAGLKRGPHKRVGKRAEANAPDIGLRGRFPDAIDRHCDDGFRLIRCQLWRRNISVVHCLLGWTRAHLRHLPQQSAWFVPVILSAYLLRRTSGLAGALRASAPVLALSALWIVPQVLLYSTRGGCGHYWLPCAIGIAGLNTAALACLSREQKGGYSARRWSPSYSGQETGSGSISSRWRTSPNVPERIQEALSAIAQRTPDTGKVLVVCRRRDSIGILFFVDFFFLLIREGHILGSFFMTLERSIKDDFQERFFSPTAPLWQVFLHVNLVR